MVRLALLFAATKSFAGAYTLIAAGVRHSLSNRGIVPMAKVKMADLLKSHQAMKRFLQNLVQTSDKNYGGQNGRSEAAEKRYQKAVRLIARAKELQP